MKKLLFIINPKAGKSGIKNDLFDIILTFSNADYEVVTYPTKGPDDAARVVAEAGMNYDIIVCAGGDGTLDNTVDGYMKMGDKKTPIGYIPVGTTNDFARSLNIPRKPVEAAESIVNGTENLIDVGRFNDDFFTYIAAFGIFTDISYSTDQSLKKALGHQAYIIEAIKNITNYKAYTIEADMDGKVISGQYIYGMVTNSFSVAGFKVRGTKHVLLDDGKFDCLFIKKPSNLAELQQIIVAMLMNNFEDSDMFYIEKATKVSVKCLDDVIPWTLDGEYGGSTDYAVILNDKLALTIVFDKNFAGNGFVNSNDDFNITVDEIGSAISEYKNSSDIDQKE